MIAKYRFDYLNLAELGLFHLVESSEFQEILFVAPFM